MDISDLLKDIKNITSYQFKQRLNQLVRENYRYQNLSEENKKLISDLVEKYEEKIRQGVGITSTIIERELYQLYQKRLKLGLTEEDLKDIREILGMFRK